MKNYLLCVENFKTWSLVCWGHYVWNVWNVVLELLFLVKAKPVY